MQESRPEPRLPGARGERLLALEPPIEVAFHLLSADRVSGVELVEGVGLVVFVHALPEDAIAPALQRSPSHCSKKGGAEADATVRVGDDEVLQV